MSRIVTDSMPPITTDMRCGHNYAIPQCPYESCVARRLHEALEEMLKYGQHEGECDNGDGEQSACSLHLAASEARAEKARAALAKARGEKT